VSQIILALSIWSDRMPRHDEVERAYTSRCSGRKLADNEVLRQRLATPEDMALFSYSRTVRGKNLSFTRDGGEAAEWFEVNPGDTVTFIIWDYPDNGETPDGTYTFTIPEGGLPNPPVRLDDERLQDGLHKYYLEHADRVS